MLHGFMRFPRDLPALARTAIRDPDIAGIATSSGTELSLQDSPTRFPPVSWHSIRTPIPARFATSVVSRYVTHYGLVNMDPSCGPA